MSLTAALNPRRSLRARFAAIMGGCGVAFALLAVVLVGGDEQAQIQQGVGQALRREAELLGRSLNITLQERLLLVRQLASQPVLASGLMDPGDVRLLLEQLRSQQPELAWLATTDVRGKVQVATGALLEGQDLAAEPWFAEGLKHPWIGERRAAGRLAAHVPLTRDGQAAHFVDLAAPLIDYQGRTLGVVVARLSWTWLDDLHRALHSEGHRPPGVDSLVLDRLGRVSIGPPALLDSTPSVPGLRELMDGGAPQVLRWPDGRDYVTAVGRDDGAQGPSASLTVVVRQREDEAYAVARQLRQRLVAGGLLAALAFMGLSVWLAGRIAGPVRALSAAAQRISRGEPPRLPAMPARRRDEVAELTQSMRTLYDELQRQFGEQQRSAARFQQLFQGAPVAIYLSVDGVLEMANAACLQLFGASDISQLRGRRTMALIHPDERDKLERRIQRMRELHAMNEPTPLVEHRIVRLDGSVRDVEITALPLDLEGAPSVHVALRDITERKRAALALAESEARLQLVLRGTGAAVWDWVLGSDAVYMSPTWTTLLGLPDGHLPAGRAQWEARVHADDLARVRADLETLASGAVERLESEFRIQAEVGVERSLLARAFLVRDAQGQPARMVGSVSDVTEFRAARRQLQEREAMLAKTSRIAKVGGWSYDLLTGEGSWTEEVARMHELPMAAIKDLSLIDQCYEPDDRHSLHKAIARAAKHGEPFQAEVRLLLSSGNRRWVRTAGEAVRENGRIVRIDGMLQDISERRQAEETVHELNAQLEARVLARTAQLRAANAELDSFAYAVSHDLRAPLRAMSGFSQALQEDHAAQLDDEARMYLDQIIQASHRMGELIDGLLTLSRCTRGELRHDDIDLSALALRAVNELRTAAPARVVQVDIEPGLRVRGDARMLDAVMRNLVGNAWKYTGRTETPRIEVRSLERDQARWIEVADNGAGFDMAHAGRLFKAFARLHRQDEFTGIGIGLATVQRIIQRHGGRIEAEATPGRGAVFRFTLPAQARVADAALFGEDAATDGTDDGSASAPQIQETPTR